MIAVGGLVLALICISTVGLAVGIALATLGRGEPHWLMPTARVLAIGIAALCLMTASLHSIAEAMP